jgi:hypothetical protein
MDSDVTYPPHDRVAYTSEEGNGSFAVTGTAHDGFEAYTPIPDFVLPPTAGVHTSERNVTCAEAFEAVPGYGASPEVQVCLYGQWFRTGSELICAPARCQESEYTHAYDIVLETDGYAYDDTYTPAYVVTEEGSTSLAVQGTAGAGGSIPDFMWTGVRLHGSTRTVACAPDHFPLDGSDGEEHVCLYGQWATNYVHSFVPPTLVCAAPGCLEHDYHEVYPPSNLRAYEVTEACDDPIPRPPQPGEGFVMFNWSMYNLSANVTQTNPRCHGSTRVVECAHGFEALQGASPEVQTCRRGLWTPPELVCAPASCPVDVHDVTYPPQHLPAYTVVDNSCCGTATENTYYQGYHVAGDLRNVGFRQLPEMDNMYCDEAVTWSYSQTEDYCRDVCMSDPTCNYYTYWPTLSPGYQQSLCQKSSTCHPHSIAEADPTPLPTPVPTAIPTIADQPDFYTCYSRATPSSDGGGGNTVFFDRHNLACNHGEVLRYWQLLTISGSNFQFNYQCCHMMFSNQAGALVSPPPDWQCTTHYTSCSDNGGGNVVFMDRHDVRCPGSMALRQWYFSTSGCSNGDVRVQYICCSSAERGTSTCTQYEGGYTDAEGGNAHFLDRHTQMCSGAGMAMTQWRVLSHVGQIRVQFTCCYIYPSTLAPTPLPTPYPTPAIPPFAPVTYTKTSLGYEPYVPVGGFARNTAGSAVDPGFRLHGTTRFVECASGHEAMTGQRPSWAPRGAERLLCMYGNWSNVCGEAKRLSYDGGCGHPNIQNPVPRRDPLGPSLLCAPAACPPVQELQTSSLTGHQEYIVTSLGSTDLLVVGLRQDGFVPAPSLAVTAAYNLTGDSLHGSARSVQCTSGHEPIAGSEPEEQRCYHGAWEQQTLVCDWIRCGADDSNPARSNTLPVPSWGFEMSPAVFPADCPATGHCGDESFRAVTCSHGWAAVASRNGLPVEVHGCFANSWAGSLELECSPAECGVFEALSEAYVVEEVPRRQL